MKESDFMPSGKWLIGYDAECLVCTSSVSFLFKRDRHDRLFFTSLNSDLSRSILPEDFESEKPGTLFLYTGNNLYFKSDAVLKICTILPFPWNLCSSFKIIPKFIRDSVYNLIARNRYLLNSDNKSCPVPSRELKERII